jgi:hypothetical protein
VSVRSGDRPPIRKPVARRRAGLREATIEAASPSAAADPDDDWCHELGAVPLALAGGACAESRRQIGMVIVGGMGFGTLLTLFAVPTVYTVLAAGGIWCQVMRANRAQARSAAAPPALPALALRSPWRARHRRFAEVGGALRFRSAGYVFSIGH